MKLIERRIGLLFAVFLSLLLIGAGKAAWLGVVKAGPLKHAASTQQTADLVVPARRGAIMDRNGTELAVSQPAMTIAATPYLIKEPTKVAAAARRADSTSPRTRSCASSPGATPASPTSPATCRPARPAWRRR